MYLLILPHQPIGKQVDYLNTDSHSLLICVCRVWGGSRAIVCRPRGVHTRYICLKHCHHSSRRRRRNRRRRRCEIRPFRRWGGSGGEFRGEFLCMETSCMSPQHLLRILMLLSLQRLRDWCVLSALRRTETNWRLLDLWVLSVILQCGHNAGI